MNSEPGMCPPAPVYKHEAIYDRRKAKPDAGSEQPRLCGWSWGWGSSSREALSPTCSGRGGGAPGARRSGVGVLGSGYRRAAFVFEARKGSGLCRAGAWRVPAPPALSPATPCAPFPSPSSPFRFPVPSPAQEICQCQRRRNSLRELRFQTKSCPYSQLRLQAATDFNFLPLNTYSLGQTKNAFYLFSHCKLALYYI